MFVRTLLGMAALATTVLGAGSDTFVCGAPEPDENFVMFSKEIAANYTMSMRYGNMPVKRDLINVDVYITYIASEQSKVLPDSRAHDQITSLKKALEPHGFTFNLKEIIRWVAPGWAKEEDKEGMKAFFRKGSYRDLNIYVIEDIQKEGVAGYCTLPVATGPDFKSDGCTVESGILADGDKPGNLVIHEVGHWLGLMHTFEGGCEGDNDGVFDTPAQKFDGNFECKEPRDSCPDKPGTDSIHNYMSYVHDSCMNEFTPGQVELMHKMFGEFRAPKA